MGMFGGRKPQDDPKPVKGRITREGARPLRSQGADQIAGRYADAVRRGDAAGENNLRPWMDRHYPTDPPAGKGKKRRR